jgi:hypothetical protein
MINLIVALIARSCSPLHWPLASRWLWQLAPAQ